MKMKYILIATLAAMMVSWSADAQSFRFITTSDAHVSAAKTPNTVFGYVVSHINAVNPRPDFWIFCGDGYDIASDSANAMAQWQTWKDIADPLSDIPLYLAIGNHDINNYGHFYGSGWHGDGTGPFRANFPDLPQNGPAGYTGLAYSFRYGNSMFCVVNTNLYSASSYSATYKVDATERAWLSAVLDTTTAVHKFVIGHAEAYPPNDSNSSLQWNVSDRDAFWQVMTSHHVEAYICGHIHLWNRDFFVASGHGNVPADTTTHQIVCAGAGGGLVSGYGGNFYHFVVWDINGASVTARVIDSYGAQRDSFGWSTASGVAGSAIPAAVGPCGRIYYRNGAIRWNGAVDQATVSVYDIAGRRVWAAEARGSEARWGEPANGVYVVRVAPRGREGSALTGKIVVIH